MLADGPQLDPRAVERLIEHRRDADVVVASYDGTRDHPAVLSRAAWAAIPDEGRARSRRRSSPATTSSRPGDMDYPSLWQPPDRRLGSRRLASRGRPLLERLRSSDELRHQLGRHRLVDRDAHEAPQLSSKR